MIAQLAAVLGGCRSLVACTEAVRLGRDLGVAGAPTSLPEAGSSGSAAGASPVFPSMVSAASSDDAGPLRGAGRRRGAMRAGALRRPSSTSAATARTMTVTGVSDAPRFGVPRALRRQRTGAVQRHHHQRERLVPGRLLLRSAMRARAMTAVAGPFAVIRCPSSPSSIRPATRCASTTRASRAATPSRARSPGARRAACRSLRTAATASVAASFPPAAITSSGSARPTSRATARSRPVPTPLPVGRAPPSRSVRTRAKSASSASAAHAAQLVLGHAELSGGRSRL